MSDRIEYSESGNPIYHHQAGDSDSGVSDNDEEALERVEAHLTQYVGAIGSRRNNDARRQRLAEHFDLSPTQLQRLRGPIGVYIGSKTPPEIAVSVMAEVLAVKNGVVLPREMEVAGAKEAMRQAADESSACVMAPGWAISNTRIGRLFSRQRESAEASITLRSRSIAS